MKRRMSIGIAAGVALYVAGGVRAAGQGPTAAEVVAALFAADPEPAQFGEGISLSGDTLIVGAPQDDNEGGEYAGSAYVFVRSGTHWVQQAKLRAADAAAFDAFGSSVALDGDTAIVGAFDHDPGGISNAGSAYVFVRNGTDWTQQAELVALHPQGGDVFGFSVGLSRDTAVVGARDGGVVNNGFVTVFVRSGSTWTQQAQVGAPDPATGDQLGWAVAVDGDTLVATAISANLVVGQTTVNNVGAAYVFVRSGAAWSVQQKLTVPGPQSNDHFGISVSLSGDTIAVGQTNGSFQHDSVHVFVRAGTAWNEQANLSDSLPGFDFGAAVSLSGERLAVGSLTAFGQSTYVFRRSGTAWNQEVVISKPNASASGSFGWTVGIEGDTLAVSAPQASLVPDDQVGAAFVYNLYESPWLDLGSALAGSTGTPQLVGVGSLTGGSHGSLALGQAAPAALAVLFVSLGSTPVPFKCGTLVPVPVSLQSSLVTNAVGGIPIAWSSWPTGLSGISLYFQYAIKDAGAVCGVALSNALRADVP